MRPRLYALAVTFALVMGGMTHAPAGAQTLADLVQACKENGGSPAMCTGLLQLLRVPGGICRDATADASECELIDGITIDEALVAAHEVSWLNRTLSLQQDLDDDQPLQDELWPHTHNAYNADAYPFQAAGGLDRNQIYTIRDQLRMGIRAVEVDIHWAPGIDALGLNSIQVCHAEPIPLPTGDTYHGGCEIGSPSLATHLAEIREWMNANPDEVVLLYLENSLDDNAEAHNQAAADIEAAFGSLVYKPASNCAPIPMDVSRKQIHDSGARVLITGNCGPGGWGAWVHDRGSRWKEGGLDYGDDFPAYPCAEERAADNYPVNWIRHWGDETGLSAAAQAGGDVTPTDALNMVRCGVNMIGLDNLVPFDPRMEQLAWSWANDEPAVTEDGWCAAQGDDGRYRAEDCTVTKKIVKKKRKHRKPKKKVVESFTAHAFACYDGSNWAVTSKQDRFANGAATCAAEGLGAFFVPWNGYENERLKDARPAGAGGVWLNYRASGGRWIS